MTPSSDAGLQPRIVRVVLVLASLVALPHSLHLPLPITTYFLVVVIWRAALLYVPRFTPHRLLLMLLTLTGVVLVYAQYQSLIGRAAGVSLLTIMLALKLMEMRRQRDVYVVVFIGFFVVVTQFLYNQSIPLTLYLLCVVICLLALMLEINRAQPSRSLLDPLKQTLLITLQCLPIALILFILFPRLTHPIWQLSGDSSAAISGLDDRVSPGTISHLTRSSAVAFRVQFQAEPPPSEMRYWRGLVLWDTDGFDWFNQQEDTGEADEPWLKQTQGQPIEYEIYLEPHYRKWLFALDIPAYAPQGTSLNRDYLLRTLHPVQKLRRYRLHSYIRYRTAGAEPQSLDRALALPDNITQRQRALVDAWRQQSDNGQAIVDQALAYFNQQPFVYTLNPPLYTVNPVDQFLFEGREGFCEHYASSFVLLMRLAGIPSRMVVGYQGGEFNPVGDYFILRQADAHAWAEVWFPGKGWQRIDPTAAVAPERIRHAIQSDPGALGSPVMFRLNNEGLLADTLRQFKLVLDAADIGWRRWVLDYNHERQFRFLQDIGLNIARMQEWLSLMLALVGLALLLIGLRISLQGRTHEDPVVSVYHKLCARLAAVGLARREAEGPMDYSRRIIETRPEWQQEIQPIFDCYIGLRYGKQTSRQKLREFRDQVQRFRP